jgi:REP element-mobilizing transposase RayT
VPYNNFPVYPTCFAILLGPLILPEDRQALRYATAEAKRRNTFSIEAWVLLPDHIHRTWTLPENHSAFSKRRF